MDSPEFENVGVYNSLAIDVSGKAHISYFNNYICTLKYASNTLGYWVTETIDNIGCSGSGLYTSIAIDLSSKVHISYYGSNGVTYATNAAQSTECTPTSIAASPTTLTLNKKTGGNVTVTVTGDGNCLVEGDTVTATIGASGKKRISVSPTSQTTNEKGQATFIITAKKKAGKARVTFRAAGQKQSISVTVKK